MVEFEAFRAKNEARAAMNEARERLKQLFLQRAVSFGTFTLASGKTSSYYINSKKALFCSETVALMSDLLFEATCDLDIQAIGGPAVGAISMATAACLSYHRAGRSIEGFFVRNEPKLYGSKSMIEGLVKAGNRVAMLDDVLTTGGSVLHAIEEIEKVGATVARVVCIVDRLQGAREALAKYDYRSLFTIADFGIRGEE
jgi:orotate phosphoribosyltransferase